MVAIVGASGAGKSSLLDVLAGVWPPTQGAVRHNGGSVVRHVTGYVPQDDVVHQRAAARNDASLRGALAAATAARRARRSSSPCVTHCTASSSSTAPTSKVGALSGGQRKRASIARRAARRGPRALFLDEPTSGLDPATAAGLMRTLRGLADVGHDGRVHDPQHRRSRARPTGSRSWRPAGACRTSARWRTPSCGSGRGATPTSTTGWSPTPCTPWRRGGGASTDIAPVTEVAGPASARCRSGRCSAAATSTC